MNKQCELASIAIDTQKGIFFVAKQKSGVVAPIHVQKHVTLQLMQCTDSECNDIIRAAGQHNPGVECEHLQAVSQAYVPDVKPLEERFVNEMLQLQILSSTSKQNCIDLKQKSITDNSPLVVYAPFELLGFSTKTKYFSVYTGSQNYYSKLKRVRVSFESSSEEWHCLCPAFKSNHSCVHEKIAKWYMYQYQKEEFLKMKNRSVY